jgi:asparagine synthase (glutamine-hydrolysing)
MMVCRLGTGAPGSYNQRLLKARLEDEMERPINRVVDLTDPKTQQLLNMDLEAARQSLLSDDTHDLFEVKGSFALVARDGELVRMARSLDRPLRFFLAKEEQGPLLVVAERMDEIRDFLDEEGYGEQFHPTYTRMVPAHHVTSLRLIGCPDPNPSHTRFLEVPDEPLPPDLDVIGRRYVGAILKEIETWLLAVPKKDPIGVLFSGGVDSGAVLLCLYHHLLRTGESPARLKAFTLAVDGEGSDAGQAREFLRQTGLEMLGEVVEVDSSRLDPFAAVEVIEDYKPLDVECATVNLALLGEIRRRYPAWRLIVDGDGGDENLKDYPIEENAELTIRSVVNNPLLYQEGWGVDCVKHSLTYSGGQSRGCVRTHAPLRKLGFSGFSPYTSPSVVSLATAIPFDELSGGSIDRLYELKGEIMRRGIRAHTDLELPVFPKLRFQQGATSAAAFQSFFSAAQEAYRSHLLAAHSR